MELGVGRSEQRSELDCPFGFACIAGPISFETTTDSIGIDVLHVRRFRSLTYSLQGGIAESETDIDVGGPLTSLTLPAAADGASLRVYSVAGELFPTPRLGVRVGYSQPDRDDFDSEAYDVAATWFFKPRIAVQFAVGHSTVDDGPESDSAALRFIGRL